MKKLFFVLLLLVGSLAAVAQTSTMTDDQIIQYIVKEQSMGTSQQQIAVKLMQRGVDVSRLQKLRKKYDAMSSGSGTTLGSQGMKSAAADRSRMNETAKAQLQLQQSGASAMGGASANGLNSAQLGQLSGLSSAQINQLVGSRWQTDANVELNPRTTELAKMQRELALLGPDSLYHSSHKRNIFGRDIFNNEYLSFEPPMNIATPEDYVLGPGDMVYVDVYGASSDVTESIITPDGDVIVNDYGPINVGGLTVAKANAKLRNILGARYGGSSIRLTVGQTRTISVNVMGEVILPGTYTLSAFATVFHALYMAGGVNDIGTLRDIKVYRNNALISTVDIYDYILRGQMTGNVRLADGDVIIVGPYDALVNITGKVKRPMWYEMKSTETLATAMSYAGGFTGDAYRNTVRLIRKAGTQYSVWNIAEEDLNSFKLMDEDSIAVDSVIARWENMVEIKGAVRRPGLYHIGGRITSVRQLVEMADGLDEMAMADHVVMHRRKADRSLEAISFNLNALLNLDINDIDLQNEDVLFIPSRKDQVDEQTLKIFGEVYYPGVYKYAEGTTVYDLLVQAGGLTSEGSEMITVNHRDGGYSTATREMVLRPFDELYVGKDPACTEQLKVMVEGEVNFRGLHGLATKNARLSDLIEQAGGVTSDGWLRGAHIVRRMDPVERERREQHMRNLRVYNAEIVASGSNAVSQQQRKDLVDSLLLERYINAETYIVGIELDKALKNPGSQYDVTLRDGDMLVVPQYDATVKISGEVNFPCNATFKSSKKAKWYINHAGGYTPSGWKRHAYVVHANGTVERASKGHKVEAGSEVIVPVRPLKSNSNVSAFTSAFTSLGTVAALLITALN